MALTLPRNFYYAAIVFAFFATGIAYLLGTITENSPTGNPDLMTSGEITEMNRSLSYGNITSQVQDLDSKLKSIKPSQKWGLVSIVSLPIAFIETAWAIIKFVIDSFGFMNDSFISLSAMIGIPSWVAPVIISLIVIMFVFSILTIIFGKDI